KPGFGSGWRTTGCSASDDVAANRPASSARGVATGAAATVSTVDGLREKVTAGAGAGPGSTGDGAVTVLVTVPVRALSPTLSLWWMVGPAGSPNGSSTFACSSSLIPASMPGGPVGASSRPTDSSCHTSTS